MLGIMTKPFWWMAAVVLVAAAAPADVITETVLANGDTFCDYQWQDDNRGSLDDLLVWRSWPTMRSYINFDTSIIPHGSLRRATLSIYLQECAYDGTVDFHRSPFTWDESTLTWRTQPAPFDQEDAYDSLTPLFSLNHAVGDGGWQEFVLFDETIDRWESSADYSFALVTQNQFQDVRFYSRDSAYAPRLDVEYEGEQIPEPATLALMSIGLGGLILKRRRSRK